MVATFDAGEVVQSKVIYLNNKEVNSATLSATNTGSLSYFMNNMNTDDVMLNGTISGATYVPGVVGNYALNFIETSDVTLSQNPQPTSISSWVKRDDENWKHIVSLNENTPFGTKEKVYINNIEANYFDDWKGETINTATTEVTAKSRDSAGEYTNTTTISSSDLVIDTFTPTKKTYLSRLGVFIADKGTGNITIAIRRNSDSREFASSSANSPSGEGLNANLPSSGWKYFTCNCILEEGVEYRLDITNSTSDATLKSQTTNTANTISYNLLEANRAKEFTVVGNGRTLKLETDSDGVLHNSVINLDAGTYLYQHAYGQSRTNAIPRTIIHSSRTITNDYYNYLMKHGNGSYDIRLSDIGTELVIKINTILPAMGVKVTGISVSASARLYSVDYSLDGITWINLGRNINYSNFEAIFNANRSNVFYIKYYKHSTDNSGANYFFTSDFKVEANLDLSGIPVLLNKFGIQAGSQFVGKLDETLFFNKNLSSEERTTLYNKGLVTDGLVAKYSFEEGSGTLAADTKNWENVKNGVKHTFRETGTQLRWKAIENAGGSSDLTQVRVSINK